MATAVQEPLSPRPDAAPASEPAPGVPDYMLDANAVLKDTAEWRHGHAPDYSGTRRVYRETKRSNHTPGSLEDMAENLVKNWEIEASHKLKVSEWRTVDPNSYTFAINGSAPQDAEHMLKVGTYNAIIAPSEYYDPKHSDFDKSHTTFRNMMPNFAWEVLEVYSPPPVVALKWRHWGVMKNDYVGWNNKGQKIRIKAHGGALDIQGLTVARLNDKLQVTALETWFDPVDMFNQMKPTPETIEIEVDDHQISKEEATEMLKSPRDSGIETLAGQVFGEANVQALADQIEGAALATKEDVHVHDPNAPTTTATNGDAAAADIPNPHVNGSANGHAAGAGGGSCPFLNGSMNH